MRVLGNILLVIVITISYASIAEESSLHNSELNNLPDGIVQARADVAPTNYSTDYTEDLTEQKLQIDSLFKKIYGLDQIDSQDFVRKAEAVYLLEHEIASFLLSIPTRKIPAFEKYSLAFRGVHVYRTLRTSGEQTYDNMLRLIDIALPGPGGPQIRIATQSPYALYEPNYRSDSPLSDVDKLAFYKEKLQAFKLGGGNISEIKNLKNDSDLNRKSGLTTYEYIQTADGQIRLTEGTAGHLVLARGKSVRAAGNIAIVRGHQGKILLLVVSNSSGTFKPDILSAQLAAEKIAKQLGVPEVRMVVTRGEPFGLQSLKILLKAERKTKQEIENKLEELKQLVTRSRSSLMRVQCSQVFKGIF